MTASSYGLRNALQRLHTRHAHRTPHVKAFGTSASPRRTLDIIAKYRPAVPSNGPYPSLGPSLSVPLANATKSDSFVTASTSPAAASFQDIPPPSSDTTSPVDGSQQPLPAMKPISPIPGEDYAGKKENRDLSPSQKRKEIVVQGIPIPPKPTPPGEEECCMSGCVHCVYTIYADDLETYTTAITSAREALTLANVEKNAWPEEMQDGSGEEIKVEEKKKVESDMDPTMAAFLAFENRLKKKQAPERSAASG